MSVWSRLKQFLWRWFPPESRMELFLRTLYHQLQANPRYNAWQRSQALRSYHVWQKQQPGTLPVSVESTLPRPKVTFLLSATETDTQEALSTLVSIKSLPGSNWEVLLFSPDSSAQQNPLIHEERVAILPAGTITSGTWREKITGEYVLFCAAGDRFSEVLLEHFYSALSSHPGHPLYYYDSELRRRDLKFPIPFFKPTALSPELMLSINYLSRAFISIQTLDQYLKAHPSGTDLLDLEYALLLHLVGQKMDAYHIPQLLVSQAEESATQTARGDERACSYLAQAGYEEVEVRSTKIARKVKWKAPQLSVAVIILSRNNTGLLRTLVNSILEKTQYPAYTINIVDNASEDPSTITYYEQISKDPRVNIIPFIESFNYSKAINLGIKKTSSDLVLLMNNDMQVIDPDWMDELVRWASQPEIGVVGPKLIRANHTIQHAGVVLGLNGFMGHVYLNAPEHYIGLAGSVDWYRNYFALTGACQMVRREIIDQVGGYNENYSLVFGDIDFCLRIHNLGYRNLYTPFACLYHYEGRSRGYISPVSDMLLAFEEFKERLSVDDPYFSPRLTYDPIPRCNLLGEAIPNRLQNIHNRKQALEKVHQAKTTR